MKFLIMTGLIGLLACSTYSSCATSIELPTPKEKSKSKVEKYNSSAERLEKEAGNLEKRLSKVPQEQRKAAEQLVKAKRDLAQIKREAASEWKEHLGDLPDDFKTKLKTAQTNHSQLQKEYYRIGREIKAKQAAASTNTVTKAATSGKDAK